jgi:hypothetical protein
LLDAIKERQVSVLSLNKKEKKGKERKETKEREKEINSKL